MGKAVPMRAESVNFSDGMIVTADDLSTATAYPVDLMKLVNRAVFGCGVVCGLELRPDPDGCDRTVHCDPCDDTSEMAYDGFTIEIGRGMALDCSGLPVELCKPVRFELGSEQCCHDVVEGEVCIFIRRMSSTGVPRGDCCSSGSRVQCSRLQDHVEIRAFPKGGPEPKQACMHPFEIPAGNQTDCEDTGGSTQGRRSRSVPDSLCECLTTCGDSDCCGEGWILLGCLKVCKTGIVKNSFEGAYKYRKWIKTIECFCPEVEPQSAVAEAGAISTLDRLRNRKPDPDIEQKMMKIVNNKERVATLMLAGVINMEHFGLVLEQEQSRLQQAFDLQTSDKLKEWGKKAAEQMREEQKQADSQQQSSV
jgi:hypothetical protein